MSSRIIKYALEQDVTDRTASQVRAANPGIWSSDAEVPEYLYQSLKTLWLGSSAASGELANVIVAGLGTGRESSSGSIVVYIQRCLESVEDPNSIFKSDTLGAESAEAHILLYTTRNRISLDFINNATNRVKYVLDHRLRGLRRLNPNLTVTTIDKSIINPANSSTGYFYCQYQGYRNTEIERVPVSELIFQVDYIRAFGR